MAFVCRVGLSPRWDRGSSQPQAGPQGQRAVLNGHVEKGTSPRSPAQPEGLPIEMHQPRTRGGGTDLGILSEKASSISVGFLLTASPLLTRARRPSGSAVSYLSIKPSGLCQQTNFPPGALAVCTAQRPGGAPTVGLMIAYRIRHPGTAKMRSQGPSRSPLAKCEMQGLHCYPPNIFL